MDPGQTETIAEARLVHERVKVAPLPSSWPQPKSNMLPTSSWPHFKTSRDTLNACSSVVFQFLFFIRLLYDIPAPDPNHLSEPGC